MNENEENFMIEYLKKTTLLHDYLNFFNIA